MKRFALPLCILIVCIILSAIPAAHAQSASTWARYFAQGNSTAFDFEQTPDGGYIMAVTDAQGGLGAEDFLVIKTDSEGIITWQYKYGNGSANSAYQIRRTTDGLNYVVYGESQSSAWLLKLDLSGNVVWLKI